MNFWVIFSILFKTRGIRFMRGLRLENPEKTILKPQDADVNFIPPSESRLREERSKLHIEAEQPCVLHKLLDAFAAGNSGEDVAVCLDGKETAKYYTCIILWETAAGIGVNLGEEDLGGLEPKPTLAGRKDRLTQELGVFAVFEAIKNICEKFETHSPLSFTANDLNCSTYS